MKSDKISKLLFVRFKLIVKYVLAYFERTFNINCYCALLSRSDDLIDSKFTSNLIIFIYNAAEFSVLGPTYSSYILDCYVSPYFLANFVFLCILLNLPCLKFWNVAFLNLLKHVFTFSLNHEVLHLVFHILFALKFNFPMLIKLFTFWII